jgi:hypothetical protein
VTQSESGEKLEPPIENANAGGNVKEVSAKHHADRLHSYIVVSASEESGTASKKDIWISA